MPVETNIAVILLFISFIPEHSFMKESVAGKLAHLKLNPCQLPVAKRLWRLNVHQNHVLRHYSSQRHHLNSKVHHRTEKQQILVKAACWRYVMVFFLRLIVYGGFLTILLTMKENYCRKITPKL